MVAPSETCVGLYAHWLEICDTNLADYGALYGTILWDFQWQQ